ncbi:MAG TPA: TMEM175 family protein [Candidatus Dormibacteraeota bacterium]|nr:TMEM175 family protein [Candidatus Dormibacteraeota bacterium]
MSRARLEAFSDGVIAVAITLLALDLAVPGPGHGTLLSQLGDRWPSFVAYLISFFTIGIIWVNHHARVADIAKVDRTLLFLNLILLLFVVAIPFATATMAEYLTAGGADARTSMVLYAGVFQGMGIAFAAMFEWSLKEGRLHHPIPKELRNLVRLRFSIGAVAYVAAIIVAFISPLISLAIIGLVAVYYVFEQGPRQLRQLQQR